MNRRLVMRLHLAVRAAAEQQAAKAGECVSRYITKLLHEELQRTKYAVPELPPETEDFLPTQNSSRPSASKSMSLYLPDEDWEILEKLEHETGYIRRYLVTGLLLHRLEL